MNWVSVKNKLPEYKVFVLISFIDLNNNAVTAKAMYTFECDKCIKGIWLESNEYNGLCEAIHCKVTHWMKLPYFDYDNSEKSRTVQQ